MADRRDPVAVATRINGDVGLSPGSAQGIPPSEINGVIHVDDLAIIDAKKSLERPP